MWFNVVKAHESLDFEHAEAPERAFEREMHPKKRKAISESSRFIALSAGWELNVEGVGAADGSLLGQLHEG